MGAITANSSMTNAIPALVSTEALVKIWWRVIAVIAVLVMRDAGAKLKWIFASLILAHHQLSALIEGITTAVYAILDTMDLDVHSIMIHVIQIHVRMEAAAGRVLTRTSVPANLDSLEIYAKKLLWPLNPYPELWRIQENQRKKNLHPTEKNHWTAGTTFTWWGQC
ncbi:hypothetical protein X975_23876, partial [Stegodyphus mimosarum]